MRTWRVEMAKWWYYFRITKQIASEKLGGARGGMAWNCRIIIEIILLEIEYSAFECGNPFPNVVEFDSIKHFRFN